MRQIGTFEKEKTAQHFVDFLITLGIGAHSEREQDGWSIWVRDEDRLEQARTELVDFRRNPEDPRYAEVTRQAQAIRDANVRHHQQVRRNTIEIRGHWKVGPGAGRRCPTVWLMIGISIVVFLLTGGFNSDNETYRLLQFSDPKPVHVAPPLAIEGPWKDIRRGQVWRLVTPNFVHGDLFHLLFNMMWLHYLGGQYEHLRGRFRFLRFILTAALVSVLALTFVDQAVGGGMSGVNYALFGYIWMRCRFAPQEGYHITTWTVYLMVAWFLYCFSMSGVANGAHAFGLGYGLILGILPVMLKKR